MDEMVEPATPKALEICSVDDFHRVLRDHWRAHFLFRGETSPDHDLRPKFGRLSGHALRRGTATERSMLKDFKRRALPYLSREPANDWEWLAIAQHFGLATRLLDWTENALIAVFFATRASWRPGDRVLYALDETKLRDADESTSPFELKEVVLYRPTHVATRITSQACVFTVHNDPTSSFVTPYTERWLLRSSCIVGLDITLDSYGITEAFVFQDLGGLARNINSEWGVDLDLDQT